MTDRQCSNRRSLALTAIALTALASCSVSARAAYNAGTGFYLTSDGYFLTCFTAVDGSKRIKLRGANGTAVDAAVVTVDRANDLALLKAEGKFSALALGSAAIAGTGASVFTVGFPDLDDQPPRPELATGIVVGRSPATGQATFQTTLPATPGFCGAPVVTSEGSVAGVLTAGPDQREHEGVAAREARNVSHAVDATYAKALLKSVQGAARSTAKRSSRRRAGTPDLASVIEQSVALVMVDTNRTVEERRSDERKRSQDLRRARRNEELRTEKSLLKLEADQARQQNVARLQMMISNLDRDVSSLQGQVRETEQRLLFMTRDSSDLSAASTRSELESRLAYLRTQLNQATRSKEAAMQKLRDLQIH